MEQIQDLIRQIAVAARNITMYSSSHPAACQSISQAHSTLSELLDAQKELTLSLVEGRLLANEALLSDSIPLFQRFASEMRDRNLMSITFLQGIQVSELTEFIESMMLKAEELMKRGGLAKLLQDRGITHVKANEIQYSRMGSLSRDDLLIKGILQGRVSDASHDRKWLLEKITKSPETLGSLMSDLIPQEGRRDSEGAAPDAAAFAKSLEYMINELLGAQPGGWRPFRKNLAKMIMALELGTQAQLMKQTIMVEGRSTEVAELFASSYPKEKLSELIAYEYGRAGGDPLQARRLFERVLPEPDKRRALVPEIEAKLEAYGVSKEEFIEVLKSDLADGGVEQQEARMFLEKKSLSLEDAAKVPRVIRSLISKGNTSDARKALNKFFNGLNNPDAAIRKAISLKVRETIHLVRSLDPQGGVEAKVEQFLLKRIKTEDDPEVLGPLIESLAGIAKERISSGKDEEGLQILASLVESMEEKGLTAGEGWEGRYRELCSSLYTDQFLQQQTELLRDGADGGTRAALDHIRRAGPNGIKRLIEALAEEPQMSKRMRLIKTIIGIGEEVRGPLQEFLRDERWYVVRNAVHILGEIGKDEDVRTIAPLLAHKDPRVRREAVQALSRISPAKGHHLILAALEDQDEGVQTKAIEAFMGIREEVAVPKLMELARKGGLFGTRDVRIRSKAIKALGAIGSERAVPLLAELLTKKGLLGKVEADEIRMNAVSALRAIGGNHALKSLKEVARSDPSRQIRSLSAEAVDELEQKASKGPGGLTG